MLNFWMSALVAHEVAAGPYCYILRCLKVPGFLSLYAPYLVYVNVRLPDFNATLRLITGPLVSQMNPVNIFSVTGAQYSDMKTSGQTSS
jgi:hypothetical protein